jgi:hypothetical protein
MLFLASSGARNMNKGPTTHRTAFHKNYPNQTISSEKLIHLHIIIAFDTFFQIDFQKGFSIYSK